MGVKRSRSPQLNDIKGYRDAEEPKITSHQMIMASYYHKQHYHSQGSIDSLDAIISRQPLASFCPVYSPINQVRDSRNHIVNGPNPLIHGIAFPESAEKERKYKISRNVHKYDNMRRQNGTYRSVIVRFCTAIVIRIYIRFTLYQEFTSVIVPVVAIVGDSDCG